jgi:hypothetical protein
VGGWGNISSKAFGVLVADRPKAKIHTFSGVVI